MRPLEDSSGKVPVIQPGMRSVPHSESYKPFPCLIYRQLVPESVAGPLFPGSKLKCSRSGDPRSLKLDSLHESLGAGMQYLQIVFLRFCRLPVFAC